jgi:drug/metabolite transporter (DMT)-like permease
MGQLDDLTKITGSANPGAAEDALKSVAQDLRNLQQELVAELTQDVRRLQSEKSRLLNDIEQLQAQQQTLQSQQQAALSQQQVAQQQLWARQLAQALAKQLQALLMERMQAHNVDPTAGEYQLPPTNSASEDTTRLLSSLDTTINRTLNSVRQDLTSYQSSLSQQISRMHNLEQQGEAILEALVSRLHQQLQSEAGRSSAHNRPNNTRLESDRANGYAASVAVPPAQPPLSRTGSSQILPVSPVTAPEPTVSSVRSSGRPPLSQFQAGLILILLSTVALSLHNVVVRIIGNPSQVFGLYELGGFISLNSLGNSLLILWMRMLVVVPLMIAVAGFLYPPVWRDIQAFLRFNDRPLLRSVVGSGFFLFLSQVLIYIAIGQIGPGVAVTILFMYPIVTVPLAWVLFGDRPTGLRVGVMLAILSGIILTAFPRLTGTTDISWLGIGTAMASGVAFALYLISMQISFRKLHPIPVSLIQFVTIFVLTSISLIIRPFGMEVEVLPVGRAGLLLGGLVLGALTLAGYLLNNFGVRFMGAARASIIAASGPVLTALLAFLVIPGPGTVLESIQIIGILIVTLGVTALSFERMLLQAKTTPAK